MVLSSDQYDAYGNRLQGDTTDVFAYGAQTGYYRDTETGLYLCTFRYYDPRDGRFLTRDPIDCDGGVNLYGYVGDNPVNGADALGLATIAVVAAPGGSGQGGHAYIYIAIGYNDPQDYQLVHLRSGNWYGFYPKSAHKSSCSAGTTSITKSSGLAGPGEVVIPDRPERVVLDKAQPKGSFWVQYNVPDWMARVFRARILADYDRPPAFSLTGRNCSTWAADILGRHGRWRWGYDVGGGRGMMTPERLVTELGGFEDRPQ